MSAAEYIEFNGDWHKSCFSCKRDFGASSLEGLREFFNRNKSRKDGLSHQCRECFNAAVKIRNKNPKHWRRNKIKSPEKYKARMTLNNAVALGKITKPKVCQVCSSPSKIHGHHDDYNKPLSVRWLCRKCHEEVHHAD